MGFNVMEHEMVPAHRLLDEEEAEARLAQMGVGKEQLPKIKRSDPVIEFLEKDRDEEVPEGQIVEVRRRSPTAGVFVAYRVVVEG